MKKCPFCKSDIEDNARFCVFCMSSLQEKEVITTKIKKRWPYILAAFLLPVITILIVILALSKNDIGNTPDESYPQSEIITNNSETISADNTTAVDKTPNNSSDTNNSVAHNDTEDKSTNEATVSNNENSSVQSDVTKPATKPAKPQDTTTETDKTTDNTTTETTDSTDNNNTTTDNSSSNADDNKNSNEQSNDTGSTNNSSNNQSANDNNTPTKTEAVYIYRDAVASDCYTEENMPAQPITNVIVITGVSVAASDGIYDIPDTIDGKKVGGIMPYAFCDSAISQTVKKVIVPNTVKTIWQNAFSSCYNLTDIYLRGRAIDIFETAFVSKNNRNGTLTIHCSSDCTNFNYYYYRNIAENYNAQYKQWNGGDIE